MDRVDVVVVGAGSAGAAAAAFCAARGMRVLVLESGSLDGAGARWVNTVPGWCFDRAGLGRPDGASGELRGGAAPFHLVAGWGPSRVRCAGADVVSVDMRALVAHLQRLAADAGAELREHVRVHGLRGGLLETSDGPVAADVFVDASGLHGARLLGPADATDLCCAVQHVRELRDRAGAAEFLVRHGAREGETLCFTGVAGPYSVVNVRVEDDTVHLLCGSLASTGQPAGVVLLERFVREQPWVGERVFGGGRVIPIGRPRPCLYRGRAVAIGDAALQVHAAHGSGVGAGLVGARMLAEALSAGEGLAGYNTRWQRAHGGLFAAADVFARMTRTLDGDDVHALITSGVLTPCLVKATLEQRDALPAWNELPTLLRGAARARRVIARLLPALMRMTRVRGHYARYPDDPAAIEAWTRALDALVGADTARPPRTAPSATVSP